MVNNLIEIVDCVHVSLFIINGQLTGIVSIKVAVRIVLRKSAKGSFPGITFIQGYCPLRISVSGLYDIALTGSFAVIGCAVQSCYNLFPLCGAAPYFLYGIADRLYVFVDIGRVVSYFSNLRVFLNVSARYSFNHSVLCLSVFQFASRHYFRQIVPYRLPGFVFVERYILG